MKLRNGSPEEAGMSPQRVRQTISAMRDWNSREGKQAAVLLAARWGVIVAHEAFGRLRPEADSPPVQLDTIFPIASISKTITATAAMVLVEEGRLGLNLPVSYHVPEFAGDGKDAVTIIHLMTHTSGLRDPEVDKHATEVERTVACPPPEPTQHPAIATYLARRYSAPLWKPPGQENAYCSYGLELLGEVIRRVSGKSLADFARGRLFDPLGMKDASYCLPDSRAEKAALSIDPVVAPFVDFWRTVPIPSGSVFSSARDLAAFGQMFLGQGAYNGERVLSPVTVAAMTRNQIPGIGARYDGEVFAEACWGLGWTVLDGRKGVGWGLGLASPSAFCHHGIGGAFLWVDPANELVGVCLAAQYTSRTFGRFSVSTRHYDGAYLFADAATAAIVEPSDDP